MNSTTAHAPEPSQDGPGCRTRRDNGSSQVVAPPPRSCRFCGRVLRQGQRRDARFCGSTCRAYAYQLTHAPKLPFAGRTPLARHHSYLAAEAAAPTRATKTARYLAWLREYGPASDHQAAEALRLPLSSICSIRNGVMDVEPAGATMSPWNRRCTLWARTRGRC